MYLIIYISSDPWIFILYLGYNPILLHLGAGAVSALAKGGAFRRLQYPHPLVRSFICSFVHSFLPSFLLPGVERHWMFTFCVSHSVLEPTLFRDSLLCMQMVLEMKLWAGGVPVAPRELPLDHLSGQSVEMTACILTLCVHISAHVSVGSHLHLY